MLARVVERLGEGRVAVLLGAALLLLGACLQLQMIIHADVAWYLHATERWLQGARLYHDIFEVNPPLAFCLTAPPVLAARLLGASSIDCFVVYVFLLICGSLLLVRAVLRRMRGLSPGQQRLLLLASLLALAPPGFGVFGEREHLMLVLALPYLVLQAARCRGESPGRGMAAAIGLAAGLGLGLKPYFLLLPAALELCRLRWTGDWRALLRAETLALGAALGLYAATLPLLAPEYLDQVVPFARAVYHAYGSGVAPVLYRSLPVVVVILFMLYRRGEGALAALADVVTVAAAVFLLAYLVQLKAWWYQLYPAAAMLVLALALQLALAWQRRPRRPQVLAVCAVAAAALLPWRGGELLAPYQAPVLERLGPTVAAEPAGSAIFIFSSNVYTGFPLVNYTGARWSSRFPTLWLLPGLLQQQASGTGDPALLAEIEAYARDAVIEDLTAAPPRLVFVDRRREKSHFGGLAFDYLDYFTADPRFAAFWRDYELLADFGSYQAYRRKARLAAGGGEGVAP